MTPDQQEVAAHAHEAYIGELADIRNALKQLLSSSRRRE